MTQLEKDIERKLVRLVKRHGGMCLKWVCPGWSGVPDRLVLMPGGHIVFVELKRPDDGGLRKLQEWWARKLLGLGFTHLVIHSQADLDWFQMYHLDRG